MNGMTRLSKKSIFAYARSYTTVEQFYAISFASVHRIRWDDEIYCLESYRWYRVFIAAASSSYTLLFWRDESSMTTSSGKRRRRLRLASTNTWYIMAHVLF